jgi:hypothetical protein
VHIKWSVRISFEEIGKKDTDIAPRKGEPSKFRAGLKIQVVGYKQVDISCEIMLLIRRSVSS